MANEDLERITILLQAKDRDLTRAIDRSNKMIARMERDAARNTSAMARSIDSNMAKAGVSVMTLGKTFAATLGVASIGAVTATIQNHVRAIAQIGDEARRSGLGVEAFQELGFVAAQSRIPIDALVDGMKELSLRADEFITTGAGPAEEAFARLGYSAAELSRRLEEPEELMLDIMGRMESLDRAAQIRVADEVFGGTGGERFVELLAHGEDGMRRMTEEARGLGLVIEAEAVTRAQKLDAEFAKVQARLTAVAREALLPVGEGIIDMLDRIRDWRRDLANDRALEDMAARERVVFEELNAVIARAFTEIPNDQLRAMLRGNIEGAEDLGAALSQIAAATEGYDEGTASFEEMAVAIEAAIATARDMIAAMEDVDAKRFGGVLAGINAIATAFANARAEASLLAATSPAPAEEAESYGQTPAPAGPVEAVLPNGRNVFHAPASSPRPKLPGVDSFGPAPGSGGGGGGGGAAAPQLDDWQQALASTRDEIARLETEAAALLAVAGHGTELGDALDYARKRAELLFAAQKAGREITPELTKEIDAQAMAYMRAGLAAEENADRLTRLQDNAERGADALSDMFMGILDGSTTAGEAVIALAAEIARIQTMKWFAGAAQAGGGGGALGWLGGLLANARGNAFDAGRVTPFAKGGVFDRPTYFPMAGGRAGVLGEGLDEEAILPLRRGSDGKLGVRAQVGGQGGRPAAVQVIGGDLVLTDNGTIMARVRVEQAAGLQMSAQRQAAQFGNLANGYNERGTTG